MKPQGEIVMSKEPKLHTIEWDMMDKTKFLPLALVNSFILRGVLYPLVLVKTKIQVQKQNTVYTGSSDAFHKIFIHEGFRGLYKGFSVNTLQIIPGTAYIAIYEITKGFLKNYMNITGRKTQAFLSGGISSAISQTFIVPMDVVSQHIMMAMNSERQSAKPHLSQVKSSYFKPLSLNQGEVSRFGIIIAVALQLYREGGIKSFYKGYGVTLLCFVPSSAGWWLSYQYLNEFLYSLSSTSNLPNMALHCMSGTLSGAAVSVMTNSLDLIRANVQVHRPSSYKSAIKYLWKEDRWRIFNKGLTARFTQNCLSSGLLVLGYEAIKRISIDDEHRDLVSW